MKNNSKIKLYTILISCTATLLCLVACSGKKEEAPNQNPQSDVKYEESTLPDEFVFPGETTTRDDTAGTADGETSASPNAAKVKSVSDYLFGYIDITEYEEKISNTNDTYAIDYIFTGDTDSSDINLLSELTIGTEKISVTFPVSASELIQNGFTWLSDEDAKTVIPPDGDSILTLCTPETLEIIGFVTKNSGKANITAADASITGIMLTSFNNFTAFGGINGTTELGNVISLIGSPDIISVSATGKELSVMLSYTDKNGSSMTILGDGATREIIAVYVVSNNA